LKFHCISLTSLLGTIPQAPSPPRRITPIRWLKLKCFFPYHFPRQDIIYKIVIVFAVFFLGSFFLIDRYNKTYLKNFYALDSTRVKEIIFNTDLVNDEYIEQTQSFTDSLFIAKFVALIIKMEGSRDDDVPMRYARHIIMVEIVQSNSESLYLEIGQLDDGQGFVNFLKDRQYIHHVLTNELPHHCLKKL